MLQALQSLITLKWCDKTGLRHVVDLHHEHEQA